VGLTGLTLTFSLSDVLRLPRDMDLPSYLARPEIAQLQWPDDVVRQWLFELADNPSFVADYAELDLLAIGWSLEMVINEELGSMGTGASDGDVIEENARLHQHWVSVRPPDVLRSWEMRGTWLVPPLLIDRALVNRGDIGLQVLEGRTRVGVLRGRLRDGFAVAPAHDAWVGRRRAVESLRF
jgi:hypothetical protein